MNLARSPHIIEISESGQEGSKVELFLGSDIGTSNPTYTLSKLIPATNKIETYYNISPYIREYFNFTHWQNATGLSYDIDTSTDFEVEYELQKYKLVGGTYTPVGSLIQDSFVDGFGYYEDGYNPSAPTVLLDEGTYFYNYDSTIPTSQNNGTWGSIDIQINVGDVVRYTDLVTGSSFDFTATTAGTKSFSRIYLTYAANGNKVEWLAGGTLIKWTAYFKPQCEPKYQPVVVDFVNRYGSWSRIFFQKAKTRTIEVKKNEYKLNPDSLPFTPEDTRQKAQFNINGTETIKLNTGWVNDNYGEYLQQMFLSEYVTICDFENNEDYAAVKVKPSSLKKQVGINDGMMNYTLEFEFAYDMINTVI
jgi:hypothetical protein